MNNVYPSKIERLRETAKEIAARDNKKVYIVSSKRRNHVQLEFDENHISKCYEILEIIEP